MQPILLSPPHVGPEERQAILRAFDSGWIAPTGPEVDAFEAELAAYTGSPACAALSSGSAALELALLAVGVRPGDEVVVQTATFAASAFAAVHIGAVPVFCDIEHRTWGMDPELLEGLLAMRAAVDRLPAAVMPVDLYGVCPDYRAIQDVCHRYGVAIVEDAAEGLGSISRKAMAGTFGRLGAYSFNGNKIITTSGGGALVGDEELIDHCRYLATQARQPVPHYEHTDIGYNFRLSNLLAALGRAQLSQLETRIARRREIFDTYRRELPELTWVPQGVTERSNCWLSAAMLPKGVEPHKLCRLLAAEGIEARPAWKPMHAQPVFAGNARFGGEVADELFARGICLPSGSAMTPAQQEHVIDAVRRLMQLSSVDTLASV